MGTRTRKTKCPCGNSLTVKDVTRQREHCYPCMRRKVDSRTLTLDRYKHSYVALGQGFTFETLPSAPENFAEFVSLLGGFK